MAPRQELERLLALVGDPGKLRAKLDELGKAEQAMQRQYQQLNAERVGLSEARDRAKGEAQAEAEAIAKARGELASEQKAIDEARAKLEEELAGLGEAKRQSEARAKEIDKALVAREAEMELKYGRLVRDLHDREVVLHDREVKLAEGQTRLAEGQEILAQSAAKHKRQVERLKEAING